MIATVNHADTIAGRDAVLDLATPAHVTLIDGWFNRTDRGTGAIPAADLTAAQAKHLHNLG